MPKIKTKKSLKKRIIITNSGNFKRANAYTSHLAQNKTNKQKRQLRKISLLDKTDKKRLKNLFIYSNK